MYSFLGSVLYLIVSPFVRFPLVLFVACKGRVDKIHFLVIVLWNSKIKKLGVILPHVFVKCKFLFCHKLYGYEDRFFNATIVTKTDGKTYIKISHKNCVTP